MVVAAGVIGATVLPAAAGVLGADEGGGVALAMASAGWRAVGGSTADTDQYGVLQSICGDVLT